MFKRPVEPIKTVGDYRRSLMERLYLGMLNTRFEEITQRRWCDVIMPDVKHVGGFGPLLDVLKMGTGKIEISPHNPSGPISTAASLHAAAVHPELVRSLEYSFQRKYTRGSTGEVIEKGVLLLGDKPGWGVAPQ
jgi:galactonate dehydratase